MENEALSVDQSSKTLDEMVSLGCKFVVDGDVFKATIDLLEKLLVESSPDKQGEAFLVSLRFALLNTSKPVKEKSNLVI
jgi:hypothetical protein